METVTVIGIYFKENMAGMDYRNATRGDPV
jgi:hypothetical protein